MTDKQMADPNLTRNGRFSLLYLKANLLSYEGEAEQAYEVLESSGRSSRATTGWPSRPWAR